MSRSSSAMRTLEIGMSFCPAAHLGFTDGSSTESERLRGIPRAQPFCLFKIRNGLAVTMKGIYQGRASQQPGLFETSIDFDGFVTATYNLLVPSERAQRHGSVQPREIEVRIQRQRMVVAIDGLRVAFERIENVALVGP